MNYSIVAEQVCKQFKDNLALDNVDLKVESGSICGLVGRNGSGKTVLMKCICGLMPLTSGEIKVNGKTIGKDVEIPESVGVIIETPGFLSSFSAYNNLKFLADISGRADKQAIRSAIKSVGLDPDSKKHVGLDKSGVEDMRRYLLDLKAEGKTILIASHSNEDIQILCDCVFEMDKGTLSQIK